MTNRTLVVGSDGPNTLFGGSGADLIYGFNPTGPQGAVNALSATRVASGLSQPVFVTAAPGDANRLFIVEKGGLIKILDLATGTVLATPFLNVSTEVSTAGERGLLGLAFDPDFPATGRFYVGMSVANGDTEIRGYAVSNIDPNQADPASLQGVITVDFPSGTSIHRGGWLGFGLDGFLYASFGDGAVAGDAQSLGDLKGKILRIDVDADAFPGDPSRNYTIPADNPFVGTAGARGEIWALGLRNPWRPGFDRGLGDLYIGDVGQSTTEEIDFGVPGANYGWPTTEGMFDPATFPGFTLPIHTYPHGSGASVTGGVVYRGPSEGLHGQYFFGDFVTGKIFTLQPQGNAWVATERTAQVTPDAGTVGSIASFGEDARGNLYVVDYGGEVFRLTPQVVSADQSDVLFAGAGDDMVFGGSGGDVIDGGGGADLVDGGPGFDVAAYYDAPVGVTLDLGNPAAGFGDAAGDFFTAIEAYVGSPHGDVMRGGAPKD